MHVCEDIICPSPVEVLASAKLKFNHLVHKVGTTAQMICLDKYIYHLGKNGGKDEIPVKQVNLHCTVGPTKKASYVDDFGNTPLPGCSEGKWDRFDNIISPLFVSFISRRQMKINKCHAIFF